MQVVESIYLEYKKGSSNKFYEVVIEYIPYSKTYQVHAFYGRIENRTTQGDGTRFSHGTFATLFEAQAILDTVRTSKLKKGYKKKLLKEAKNKVPPVIKNKSKKIKTEEPEDDQAIKRFLAILE